MSGLLELVVRMLLQKNEIAAILKTHCGAKAA